MMTVLNVKEIAVFFALATSKRILYCRRNKHFTPLIISTYVYTIYINRGNGLTLPLTKKEKEK